MTRELHQKNKHYGRYDFDLLIKSTPELDKYVITNIYGDRTINFFDPAAVKMLNKALLKHFYGIEFWDIPENCLCPPIPGRADYIHHIADLLEDNKHSINYSKSKFGFPENDHKFTPSGTDSNAKKIITCLDIGVGANCIYPLIGCVEYGWNFIGSDIDPIAIESAKKIVQKNPQLKCKIELRLQRDSTHFFSGILKEDEQIDITICNPPFHSSPEEAREVAQKKLRNLMQNKAEQMQTVSEKMNGEFEQMHSVANNMQSSAFGSETESENAALITYGKPGVNDKSTHNNKPVLNFGGQNSELWCPGGEEQFVREMAKESRNFAGQCRWFSSLVAKKESLKGINSVLKKVGAAEVKTIPMGQGNKISRIVAWRF